MLAYDVLVRNGRESARVSLFDVRRDRCKEDLSAGRLVVEDLLAAARPPGELGVGRPLVRLPAAIMVPRQRYPPAKPRVHQGGPEPGRRLGLPPGGAAGRTLRLCARSFFPAGSRGLNEAWPFSKPARAPGWALSMSQGADGLRRLAFHAPGAEAEAARRRLPGPRTRPAASPRRISGPSPGPTGTTPRSRAGLGRRRRRPGSNPPRCSSSPWPARGSLRPNPGSRPA
jgi:hypothetical protein